MTQSTAYTLAVDEIQGTASDSRNRAGGFFVVLAAQFLAVAMRTAAMAPSYDFGAAAISDLGVIAETALVFTISLIAVGLFPLLGGCYCYRIHGERWLFATFALAGVGAVGAGVFPLDTGGLHSLFALLAFVLSNGQALGTATRSPG
ncbi:DUF998 domain-containing protein [Natrinema salaciae]|uniref:DUF998 domain-containing protein n=1 Tax=Natrinema salaciae TaxID=1186196 RepID=UPI0024820A81|nr:DUF998 domain-containing protein [Natrinema salaciae]